MWFENLVCGSPGNWIVVSFAVVVLRPLYFAEDCGFKKGLLFAVSSPLFAARYN